MTCSPILVHPAYCESFNSKLRDELLNGEIFSIHYNPRRRHSTLGYLSPVDTKSKLNKPNCVSTKPAAAHSPTAGIKSIWRGAKRQSPVKIDRAHFLLPHHLPVVWALLLGKEKPGKRHRPCRARSKSPKIHSSPCSC